MDSNNLIIQLNQRIDIVNLREETDKSGEIVVHKSKIASVWASVKPISNSEWLGFKRKDHSTYYSILIRFLPEIQMGHFISFKGKKLEINSILHDEEGKSTTQITAEEKNKSII